MGERGERDRLSPAEHAQIRQDIRSDYLSASIPQDRPRAIIIAGQPGAGKGFLARGAQDELAASGGSVLIDPDRLRGRHTNYQRHVDADDKTAASLVHDDASRWAKELRQDAVAGRRNIVLDGTLNDKDKARELLGQLRTAGYETEVRAVAVHRRESRQGVYARYEDAKQQGREARWVPEDIQDEAYAGTPVALGHIERGGWADKVAVVRRDGSVVYRNDRAASATSGLSQTALMAERARQPTAEELLRHLRDWDRIQGQMEARRAGSRDLADVSGFRQEALDRLKAGQAPAAAPGRAAPTPRAGEDSIRALSAAQKARHDGWER